MLIDSPNAVRTVVGRSVVGGRRAARSAATGRLSRTAQGLITALSASALAASALLLGSPSSASAQLALQDGDTVVFLGNGVVQQHQFTAMVETCLRLRYPEHKLRFVNGGTFGSTVEKVNARLPEVLAHKPTMAVICFGLYEGNFRPFDQGACDRFGRSLEKLLDALAAAKVRVVLCTPTPVDPNRPYQGRELKTYHETLARFADRIRQEANDRKLPVVELLEPLRVAEAAAQKANPKWSVYDAETSILLSPAGHMIVAVRVLDTLAAHRSAGHLTGEFRDGVLTYADVRAGGQRGNAQTVKWSSAGGAVLTLRDLRRPVPLADYDGLPGGPMVVSYQPDLIGLNSLHVRLTGLPSGWYHLRLDGRPLGTFSGGELAAEVDVIARASPAARALLTEDLRRISAGVALKDGLLLKRHDPAAAKDAKLRARLDQELTNVNARLDSGTAELARPMLLTVLPGLRAANATTGPAESALLAGRAVRHLIGDRYYQLILPTGWQPGQPVPLLVWLHADGSAPERFEEFFRPIADRHKLAVALPASWASEWRSELDRIFVRDSVIKPLREVLKLSDRQVFVAGHGHGAALAVELAVAEPELIRGVVGVSLTGPVGLPAAPPTADPKIPRPPAPAVFLIHGTNDPAAPVAALQPWIEQRLEPLLKPAGGSVTMRTHDKQRRIPDGLLEDGLKFLLGLPAPSPGN